MNGCKNCGNAIFNPVFGDYKCYVKERGCSRGELENGCPEWSEKRAVKVETKEVKVGEGLK